MGTVEGSQRGGGSGSTGEVRVWAGVPSTPPSGNEPGTGWRFWVLLDLCPLAPPLPKPVTRSRAELGWCGVAGRWGGHLSRGGGGAAGGQWLVEWHLSEPGGERRVRENEGPCAPPSRGPANTRDKGLIPGLTELETIHVLTALRLPRGSSPCYKRTPSSLQKSPSAHCASADRPDRLLPMSPSHFHAWETPPPNQTG